MDLTYDNIISLLILDFEEYVPDGVSYSRPVIGQEDGQIVDCFFLYNYDPEKSEFSAPIARLALESYQKRLVYYYSSHERPFGEVEATEMLKVVSPYSMEQRLDAGKKYPDCYMGVREFAFQESLSQDQLSALSEYLNILTILVPVNQKIFYVNLSPAFFEWMTNMLNYRAIQH